jgi:hypothetical protein
MADDARTCRRGGKNRRSHRGPLPRRRSPARTGDRAESAPAFAHAHTAAGGVSHAVPRAPPARRHSSTTRSFSPMR